MPLDNKTNNRHYTISTQNRDPMMLEHISQMILAHSRLVGNKHEHQKDRYIILIT